MMQSEQMADTGVFLQFKEIFDVSCCRRCINPFLDGTVRRITLELLVKLIITYITMKTYVVVYTCCPARCNLNTRKTVFLNRSDQWPVFVILEIIVSFS